MRYNAPLADKLKAASRLHNWEFCCVLSADDSPKNTMAIFLKP